ncbi:MAG TPA: protein kinase [Terriglobales bacterium]|jgi:serine/threonine protein kinase|nr:protein kinase [Terriglobales bacterium]
MKYCDTCHSTFPTDFSVCPKDQSPLRETEELLPGMVLRGKYEILDKIGAGGMASVYRARHLTFDEIRAIKVVSNQLARDEKFLKRFKNEAIIARKLRHPNAVRIDDFDTTEDGRPFIVMDYVEGKSLRQVLHEEGALPTLRAIRIARQVAAALDAAHYLGIVHRDIKPDNILIVPMPAKSEYGTDIAKVLDFGVAMFREGATQGPAGYTPTQTSMVVGTPQYISPEQAVGKPGSEIDGRADLYSLGVVLYEMLTGVPPFESDTAVGMLLHQLQTAPQPPRERCPDRDIPPEVSALVMRALEKDPDRRFRTADEMTQALSDPKGWGETVVLGSGGFPPVKEPATPPQGAGEFQVKPAAAAPAPAKALGDDLDLLYTANAPGSRNPDRPGREPGLLRNSDFGGVDFDAMLKSQEPEPPEPPEPQPSKPASTVAIPTPAAVAARPVVKPQPKPAPPAAVRPAPPSPPRPTPPPGPAKPVRTPAGPKATPTETVYQERKPKGAAVALPAWLPTAGLVAVAALVVAGGAIFAWKRSQSPRPAASATTSIPTRPDSLILQDVKEALKNSQILRRVPIEASVQNGVVTLSGKTYRANVPAIAQAVAVTVPGVVQVDNRIEVVGAQGTVSQPDAAGQGRQDAASTPATPAPARRPAPFGGAEEAPPVPGALPSASDQGVGVQQIRIQQQIDMGNYRLAQHDYQGAAQAFRRALALDPNNAAARQGLRQAEQGR